MHARSANDRWRERQVAQLQEKLAKEGRARASAEGEVARLRGDVAEMRQELEGAQRWARGTDSEARSRDVRLNRALEEARKAKEKLVVECAANADDAEGKRREQKRLETRANRLERQKNELLAAFRKQVKLIDVLKRQKVHIEAARALLQAIGFEQANDRQHDPDDADIARVVERLAEGGEDGEQVKIRR